MRTEASPLCIVHLGCLICCLFPLAIFILASIYGSESDIGMEPPWSLYAIDSIFLADLCFTALLIWWAEGKRFFAAVISMPLLGLTAVCWLFGGLWVSGNYL
jgi:hypothetical protein